MRRAVLILLVVVFPGAIARAQTIGLLNVALPTLGGELLWSDQLVYGKWRIQRNELGGHCRLLDPADERRAAGTEIECRAAFDLLKRESEIPPLHGKAVITLHGLGRTRTAMNVVGRYLEQYGGYSWINVSYASTRRSLDEHAQSLAGVIEGLEGIDEIHFVAHSLGNLVVRRYLGEVNQEQPRWRPDPRIRRMVMLAPPNNGAQFARMTADLLQDNDLVRLVAGPSVWQLAREWDVAQKALGTPNFEFGIIAGGFGQTGLNPLLGGNDDLVVTVEETRLAGAGDFRIVPCRHGGMVNDAIVLRYVDSFLRHGYFTTATEREPIIARVSPPISDSPQAVGAGQ